MTKSPGRAEVGPQSIPVESLDSFCPGASHHTCSERNLKLPPSIDSNSCLSLGTAVLTTECFVYTTYHMLFWVLPAHSITPSSLSYEVGTRHLTNTWSSMAMLISHFRMRKLKHREVFKSQQIVELRVENKSLWFQTLVHSLILEDLSSDAEPYPEAEGTAHPCPVGRGSW